MTAASNTSTWRAQLLSAIGGCALLVAVAVAYAGARDATFVWDDHVLTAASAPFRHASLLGLARGGFWPDGALGDHQAPYYRPLVLLSLRLDVALGGAARDFHESNILLHLIACTLLVVVARRLGAKTGPALLAALLWGVAPRLTESVAWISGRTDLLAGVLGLAALALSPDLGPRREHRVVVRSVLAGLCLFGALCSKEVAVAFLVALLVAHSVSRKHVRTETLRVGAYVLGPLALYVTLRALAIGVSGGARHALGGALRLATVLEAIGRYVEMIFDATSPRTSIGMIGEPDRMHVVLGGFVLVGFIAWLRFRRPRSSAAWVATSLVVVALLPVLHVFPLALAGAVTADRMLYVPAMGLALALASGLSTLRGPAWSVAQLAMIALGGVFVLSTRSRVLDYGDEVRFWVTAAEHAHPHNVTARNGLANVASSSDDIKLACRLYERSAAVLKASPQATLTTHKRTLENLVSCWARDGRYAEARSLAEELARAYPDSGRVRMGLGFARLHIRDFDGATLALTQAIALDPALAKTAQPVLAAMPPVRSEWERLRPPGAAETDALGWARHLAAVGRAREANDAFRSIATEDAASLIVRQHAIDFLVFDGNLEFAESVVMRTPYDIRRRALVRHLEERRARRSRVDSLRARVDALAVH